MYLKICKRSYIKRDACDFIDNDLIIQ